jgi:hypothetical protein
MARKSRSITKRRNARLVPTKTYRILIKISPHETAQNLGKFRIDHCCMPQPRPDKDGTRHLHSYASGSTVVQLRRAGRKVKVLSDAEAEGKRVQEFISKRDRFKVGRRGPAGVGKLV